MASIMFISRHDYRSDWRVNCHFLADAFVALGWRVRFVSVGYSLLSHLVSDRRLSLDRHSNQWQTLRGVDCYLWKTPVHPFNKKLGALEPLTSPLFALWSRLPCPAFGTPLAETDIIVVESDLSAVLVRRIRAAAPKARIIYLSNDLLETIGAHKAIGRMLFDARRDIDDIYVVARSMAPAFSHFGRPVYFVSHGVDTDALDQPTENPYSSARNAVTVGSMLFDASVIQVAAEALPDVTFHLIGTPPGFSYPANVQWLAAMPFANTLPYLQHASVGIAPYRYASAAGYLSDSSMKLKQYGYLGLAAVCPDFAVGDAPGRFGYLPANEGSIVSAFHAALAPGACLAPAPTMTWQQAALRFARPDQFPEARLPI